MTWLIDKDNNWAMSCLPKNGSMSLRTAFRAQPVSHEEVLDIPKRIVWLRNTQERLVSNYSFFKLGNEKGAIQGEPLPERTESWETFVDFILDDNYDPHWGCQVDQLTHNGIFLGTAVHRFEDIRKLWGNYYRGMIPEINGCVHELNHPYRQDEINKKYAKDIDLWLSVT